MGKLVLPQISSLFAQTHAKAECIGSEKKLIAILDPLVLLSHT